MLVRKNVEWLRAEFAVLRNQQLERQRQVNQLQSSVPAKPAGPGKPSKKEEEPEDEATKAAREATNKLEDVKRKIKRRQEALKQQERELMRLEKAAQAAGAQAAHVPFGLWQGVGRPRARLDASRHLRRRDGDLRVLRAAFPATQVGRAQCE